jgi:hypothetical protein
MHWLFNPHDTFVPLLSSEVAAQGIEEQFPFVVGA